MTRYVALLRGINVGGKNIIKMIELKACFEAMGFTAVVTYIQSGNVIFHSKESDLVKITDKIETALTETFSYKSRVVVRSDAQIKRIIADAPPGWGTDPNHKYNFVFIKEPATAPDMQDSLTPKDGIESITVGDGVLYWSVRVGQEAKAFFARLPGKAIYQHMTIRNYNTTMKILALLESA